MYRPGVWLVIPNKDELVRAPLLASWMFIAATTIAAEGTARADSSARRVEVAGATALPDDARLQSVRASLQQTLESARARDLPEDVLVRKVREGLAKNVEPQALVRVVERLTTSLAQAREMALAVRGPGDGARPPAALLEALARAEWAGVDGGRRRALLGARDAGFATRALDAATGLASRGYPAGPAADVVLTVSRREPAALARVVSVTEGLRHDKGLTPTEAIEVLGQSLQGTPSLEAARRRSADDVDRGVAAGHRSGRPDDDERPGRGNGLGLGHLKADRVPPGKGPK